MALTVVSPTGPWDGGGGGTGPWNGGGGGGTGPWDGGGSRGGGTGPWNGGGGGGTGPWDGGTGPWDGGGGRRQCPRCSKTLSSKYALQVHERDVHATGPRTYACKICSKVYASQNSYRVHMSLKHRPGIPPRGSSTVPVPAATTGSSSDTGRGKAALVPPTFLHPGY